LLGGLGGLVGHWSFLFAAAFQLLWPRFEIDIVYYRDSDGALKCAATKAKSKAKSKATAKTPA
jgi:hypothetical protein